MFDFGIKKRNTSTKSIMLDEVDDKYYIPQEKLDRFYEETSNGGTRGLKRIGFIMSMDEYETAPNESLQELQNTIEAENRIEK